MTTLPSTFSPQWRAPAVAWLLTQGLLGCALMGGVTMGPLEGFLGEWLQLLVSPAVATVVIGQLLKISTGWSMVLAVVVQFFMTWGILNLAARLGRHVLGMLPRPPAIAPTAGSLS